VTSAGDKRNTSAGSAKTVCQSHLPWNTVWMPKFYFDKRSLEWRNGARGSEWAVTVRGWILHSNKRWFIYSGPMAGLRRLSSLRPIGIDHNCKYAIRLQRIVVHGRQLANTSRANRLREYREFRNPLTCLITTISKNMWKTGIEKLKNSRTWNYELEIFTLEEIDARKHFSSHVLFLASDFQSTSLQGENELIRIADHPFRAVKHFPACFWDF
jgi:hypothetical protein